MLAVSQGRLIALGTPHGKRGRLFDAFTNGGDLWERYEIPASIRPRISKEFLAEELRALGERSFEQEYMCA